MATAAIVCLRLAGLLLRLSGQAALALAAACQDAARIVATSTGRQPAEPEQVTPEPEPQLTLG